MNLKYKVNTLLYIFYNNLIHLIENYKSSLVMHFKYYYKIVNQLLVDSIIKRKGGQIET